MKSARGNGVIWETAVARAIGVSKVNWSTKPRTEKGPHGVLTIPCAHGGHDADEELPTAFPADIIKTKLANRGWTWVRRKPCCPTCSAEIQAQKEADKMRKTNTATTAATTASETAIAAATKANDNPKPTPSAKAAKRAVMEWLNEAFEMTSAEEGRYKKGFSDKMIADDTGVSEKMVAGIREEFFGIIARPSELDAFKAEIDTLRREAERFAADAASIHQSMLDRISNAETKIRALAEKNGWVI